MNIACEFCLEQPVEIIQCSFLTQGKHLYIALLSHKMANTILLVHC
jgi:hypothetical protein